MERDQSRDRKNKELESKMQKPGKKRRRAAKQSDTVIQKERR